MANSVKNKGQNSAQKYQDKEPVRNRDRKMGSQATLGHRGGEKSSNTGEPARQGRGKH